MKKIYFAVFLFIVKSAIAGWYSDWSYRKPITNNFAVLGDLTNFPLLVVISNDSDLTAGASDNGFDILFTLKNGTAKLAHELEYYSSGTVAVWIKMPILSVSEQDSNIIYMYYDKSKSGNQQNSPAVWNGHQAVFHLSSLNDSTAAGNMLSSTGPAYNASGLVAGNYAFSGSGKLSCAELNNLNFPQTAGTISMWAKGDFTSQSSSKTLFDGYGTSRSHLYIRCNSGPLQFCFQTNAAYAYVAARGIIDNAWNYLTITYNTTTISHYSNNGYFISAATLATPNEPSNQNFDLGISFTGNIDEVRLSSVIRSSNWIMTEYSNQFSPTGFCSLGAPELYPGVIFTSIAPAATPCAAGDNTAFTINAHVLVGNIASVNISWGDGQNSVYSPGITNISAESYFHEFTARSNFTVTAVLTASSGLASTNSIVISTLPYRFYNPYNICFSPEPKGCLIKWNITTSANIAHFNLYREGNLQARIENTSLREYLDERIIFGDRHAYWMEAVYPAGSAFSATNTSAPHAVYRREAQFGSGGGNLDTLIAGLYAPQNTVSSSCTISMNIISNIHTSFYESGKPVYHQVELTGDAEGKIRGGLVLKFRIPATNGSLSFKPAVADGYSVTAHKDKFFCALWDGFTWTPLSTAVYENRLQNNFSFLELETSINKLGIYGVLFSQQGAAGDEPVKVKNRLFVPDINSASRSSVQISFPNPERAQVKIQVFDMYGKIVREDGFNEWISFWSWNGCAQNGNMAASGLYVISIIVGGRGNEAIKVHSYLLK
ncbi:MAG: hypothetical protein A2096_14960 [Spirochaetes bacterium GWF1_41_5]|nr:MAG: hypothetical protein A2096_14960 [Spirochaetes bacterium GWF1_41_5]